MFNQRAKRLKVTRHIPWRRPVASLNYLLSSLVWRQDHNLPHLGARAAYFKQALREKLIEHKQYVCKHGDDMPEIAGWRWSQGQHVETRATSTEGDNV